MANSFEFIQQRPTIQKALDQAHGLGLDNIAFDTFVDVGDRYTIWRTLFSDGILTFESDYKCPFKHIAATIEPVQDGTGDPSPDNVRPISGWTWAEIQRTGKNLLPNKKYQDTSIRVQLGQDSADYFLMKAGTYKLSYGLTSGITAGAYWRVRGGAVQNSTNIVLAEDSEIQIWLYRNPLSADDVLWWQLELGSTATAYEAYQGSSLSINWEDEAGTVYGSTIAIDEDGSCKLTVGRKMIDCGSLIWNYSGDTVNHRFSAIMPSDYKYPTSAADRANVICSSYASNPDVVSRLDVLGICGYQGSGSMFIRDLAYSDTQSFREAINGVQLVYELATPIDYTLPDVTMLETVLGTNNIWASTGGIAVTYKDVNPIFLTDPLNVGVMTLK